MTIDAWIFDLDGTLVDSWPGIVRAMGHACEHFGIPPFPEAVLRASVGRPLPAWCADLFGEDRAMEATRVYREYYGVRGWLEYSPYPGVPELLSRIGPRYIATSKLQRFAEMMVAREGWRFDAIYGVAPEDRDDKIAMLAKLLREHALDPHRTAMVGDRGSDILAARANGLVGIGVTFGFGSRLELEAAGAARIVDGLAELG